MAGYPSEFEFEQQDIARQRAIAQVLQNTQGPDSKYVGDRYVAPSVTQQLSAALAQYRGNQQQKQLDVRQKALADQLAGRRTEWLNSMPQATQGREMGPPTEDGQMGRMPDTNPTSQDYLRWSMAGMNIDPQAAQFGMRMADAQETREARAQQVKMAAEQRIFELQQRAQDQRLAAQERQAAAIEAERVRQEARVEMAKLTASLRPAPSPNLVQVEGADGQPVYMDAREAAGKKAYNKPAAGSPATSEAAKVKDASEALALIDQAGPLIDQSTGSGMGSLIDSGAGFFGKSTQGAQAAAQLKAIEGMLVSKMPKMSGPQSDKDVELYRQMAAKIGDPNVPRATKKAALEEVRKIQLRYAGQGGATGTWDPKAPVAGGNIVVDY